MKPKPYSRKYYPSRGILQFRDKIYEATKAGNCIICEATLIRKERPNGTAEGWQRFLKRKTCGNYYNEIGEVRPTECLQKWHSIPENNGRYKGIMPKCKNCDKKISYKNHGQGSHERCNKCYKKYMYQSGGFLKNASINLSKYAFPKGHKSGNPFKKGHECEWKGKKIEDILGKRKKKSMYKKMVQSRERYKDQWILKLSIAHTKNIKNTIIHNNKIRKEYQCLICKKTIIDLPWKNRKTCSFVCSGKFGGGRPTKNLIKK